MILELWTTPTSDETNGDEHRQNSPALVVGFIGDVIGPGGYGVHHDVLFVKRHPGHGKHVRYLFLWQVVAFRPWTRCPECIRLTYGQEIFYYEFFFLVFMWVDCFDLK